MTGFITPLNATQQADEMPDMALLEYLAELVEVDGELVGPMDMAENLENEENEQDSGQQDKPQQNRKTTDNQPAINNSNQGRKEK